jgi:thiol-disulfide isomerase/thioredoxin
MEVISEMTSIDQVVGKKFLRKKSYLCEKERENFYIVEECGIDEFSDCKFVLLFFSGGWCAPCEQFAQVLKDFYSEVNIDGKLIEVIYVGSDKSEQEFKDNYAKMPWVTFSYSSPMHT